MLTSLEISCDNASFFVGPPNKPCTGCQAAPSARRDEITHPKAGAPGRRGPDFEGWR
jgi:hypothetical protein